MADLTIELPRGTVCPICGATMTAAHQTIIESEWMRLGACSSMREPDWRGVITTPCGHQFQEILLRLVDGEPTAELCNPLHEEAHDG